MSDDPKTAAPSDAMLAAAYREGWMANAADLKKVATPEYVESRLTADMAASVACRHGTTTLAALLAEAEARGIKKAEAEHQRRLTAKYHAALPVYVKNPGPQHWPMTSLSAAQACADRAAWEAREKALREAATAVDRCLSPHGLGGMTQEECEEIGTRQLCAREILALIPTPSPERGEAQQQGGKNGG